MERIIALILLVILSPFLLIIYLLVKLSSKGPFIFRQKRIGKDFKVFTLYKIRTMREDAEKLKKKISYLNETDGPVFKIKDDPRFTKIGKWLSRIGFDEVLQLINIIRGEMAFVGPRPLPVEEAKKVPKIYWPRFSVKPGITSLWVIKGAHNLTFDQWMASDVEYVKKCQMSNPPIRRANVKCQIYKLYIIFLTILLVTKWTIKELFQLTKKSS